MLHHHFDSILLKFLCQTSFQLSEFVSLGYILIGWCMRIEEERMNAWRQTPNPAGIMCCCLPWRAGGVLLLGLPHNTVVAYLWLKPCIRELWPWYPCFLSGTKSRCIEDFISNSKVLSKPVLSPLHSGKCLKHLSWATEKGKEANPATLFWARHSAPPMLWALVCLPGLEVEMEHARASAMTSPWEQESTPSLLKMDPDGESTSSKLFFKLD